MSTWRLAARIAWREVRRRPGRTGLVMLLIALPVMGMTAASMVVRAGNLSAEQRFEQRHGQADLVAWLGGPGDSVAADLDALRSVLPGGSEVVPYFGVDSSIGVLRDGRQIASYVTLTDLPLREPVTTGIIDIERGVAPDRAEEMLISPDLASDWGVDIGDRVDTTRPTASWTVTGIGRQTQYLRQSVVVVGELDPEIVRAGARNDRALVRLRAGPPDPALLDRIARLGLVADHAAGADDDGRSDGDALLWGWVGGAVGLAVIGVVASAAFATSGRRQLVTVGQLSANGAGEHVIRRTFLLQGAWSGLLGAALGIVVGAAITSRWWWLAELGADRRLVADRWAPLDLVVIAATATLAATIAALVPSWSASRLPVLAALAGRRPLGRPARWVAPLGLASTIGGLLVLAAAAVEGEGDRATALGVVGGLALLLGGVLASTLVVVALGRLTARAAGVVRLAAREIGRDRRRSAAIVAGTAAVAGVAAVAVVVAATSETSQRDRQQAARLPANTFELVASSISETGDQLVVDEVPARLRADVDAVALGATWTRTTAPARSIWRIERATTFSEREQEQLSDVVQLWSSMALVDPASDTGGEVWWSATFGPTDTFDADLVQGITLAVSLVLVLGVVTVGLSLTAAENRPERSILRAVGASPRTLARLTATTAWLQATTGIVIAVPLGYLAVAVLRPLPGELPTVPWLGIALLVVVIPALVAAGAWLASTIATRVTRRRGDAPLSPRLTA